ncbi:MAG: Uma2 family endonuclease [Planctomycetia bacterium]|nr:Uma2 family endonuclease [Planctomycetia bacterium]
MSTAATSVPYTPTFLNDASIATFSTARYDAMVKAGFLTPDDKVELLENYVVLKMPRDPAHDGTIDVIHDILRVVPAGWFVRIQQTLALIDSRPEPDFAIVRGNSRTYLTHHPTPPDVGLLIEVANTSLMRDRQDKARIYARANVVCYWIVNLEDRRIEVYTQPSGPGTSPAYASVQHFVPGDVVPLVLNGTTVASIPVADLLP